jgi:predicted esterase YcpF (UPF0227 family)
MEPQEIKNIIDELNKTENWNFVYFCLAIFSALAPLLVWATRITFKRTISQIVDKTIAPQMELVKEVINQGKTESDQMFRIMEMHIDELRHIKIEQEEIKRRVNKNSKDIKEIKN